MDARGSADGQHVVQWDEVPTSDASKIILRWRDLCYSGHRRDNGRLDFPGGKATPDETPLACARRELLEEVAFGSVEQAVLCEGLLEKCSDGKRAPAVGNLKGSWDARYVVMTKEGLWWFKTKEAYESKDAAAQGMFTEMASSDLNVRPSARLLPEPAFASSETECFVTARGQYDDTYLWMQFITPDRILSLRCATVRPG